MNVRYSYPRQDLSALALRPKLANSKIHVPASWKLTITSEVRTFLSTFPPISFGPISSALLPPSCYQWCTSIGRCYGIQCRLVLTERERPTAATIDITYPGWQTWTRKDLPAVTASSVASAQRSKLATLHKSLSGFFKVNRCCGIHAPLGENGQPATLPKVGLAITVYVISDTTG